ncbi:MAG: hypothetical protein J6X40_04325 [Bacteroidales bacterium]|jgi:hypothetical protein|nr:hypothetical protein [Bacteroidales bacterium]
MIITGKMHTFAQSMAIGMKTITLRFDPNSEFAVELDKLIRNSKDVSVVKRKKPRKKQTHLEKALQEIKEGKVTTYSSVDELFADLGI